jgi:endonuclease YncB( thermonuclease family)
MSRLTFSRSRQRSRPNGPISLVLALALAFAAAVLLKPSERRVEGQVQVIDGDSLRVSGKDLRLKGIDAPEMRQTCVRASRPYRCGEVARAALLRHIAQRPLQCRVAGHDRYRRGLARCFVDSGDIGAWLVAEGFAVAYGGYEAEEARARSRGAGLWAGEFERPDLWRRSRRP